jgi:hypothetical protein
MERVMDKALAWRYAPSEAEPIPQEELEEALADYERVVKG